MTGCWAWPSLSGGPDLSVRPGDSSESLRLCPLSRRDPDDFRAHVRGYRPAAAGNRGLIPYGILLKVSYCGVAGYHWLAGGIPAAVEAVRGDRPGLLGLVPPGVSVAGPRKVAGTLRVPSACVPQGASQWRCRFVGLKPARKSSALATALTATSNRGCRRKNRASTGPRSASRWFPAANATLFQHAVQPALPAPAVAAGRLGDLPYS